MHSNVDGFSRLSMWQRVREYAVPLSMIELSTTRRLRGDWVGACATARVDVDLDVDAIRRQHGGEVAAALRDDLTHLAPDLLRWHMPRVLPDGLLRPGLTIALARYPDSRRAAGRLVVRTPPAWAAGPQRMSLAWWDGHVDRRHPHPHPHARHRLDLHRHLWDARRTHELRRRSGDPHHTVHSRPTIPSDWAVDRWAPEAAILRHADDLGDSDVEVAVHNRRRLVLRSDHGGWTAPDLTSIAASPGRRTRRAGSPRPVLPEAATRIPPDLLLLHAGLITPDALHPLVAEALDVQTTPRHKETRPAGERQVECRGATHRVAVVDGVLTALDHHDDDIRREELLARLTGTPLPCLQVIDQCHRAPSELADVRARLRHGDVDSAIATVAELLGSEAVLRAGDLQDSLASAAAAAETYDTYRRSPRDADTPSQTFRAARLAHRTPRRQRDRYTRRRLSSLH